MMHHKTHYRTWVILALILVTMFVSGWSVLNRFFQNRIEKNSDDVINELAFLASHVKERLQHREYQLAESFITDWGERTPDVNEIILTAKSGYELAKFSRSEKGFHQILKKISIPYSYDNAATLKLNKNLDSVYTSNNILRYEFLAGFIIVSIVLIYVAFIVARIQDQKKELIFENTRRIRSEKLLLEAQSIARLGSWILDHKKNKLDWSQEVYNIFEVQPELVEPSYELFLNATHPDDREFVDKAYTDSIKNNTPYNIDHRLLMKDGRIKYINERCKTTYDDNGEPSRSFGTVHDMTERKQAETQARQGKLVLDSVFKAIPDLFFLMEEDGTIIDYRAQHSSDLFMPVEAFLGKRMQDILPPNLSIQFSENMLLVSKQGDMIMFEYGLELQNELKQFEARLSQLPDSKQLIAVIRNITSRKQQEERIRTLSQAIEQSPVSVIITDVDANIEYVNTTFERVTGYSAEEVIGKNPRFLKSGKTTCQTYQQMWSNITNGQSWQGELLNRKKNGDEYWEYAHIAPVLDESGEIRHFLAVREDVTLRKQQEEKIIHQAHFDALTDLPNRFLSLDRLSQLIREAERNNELVAIVFFDLDDFKKINDTLGHDIGDRLLVKAAGRLQEEVRSGDTVGRLGGDEFIVLLGGLSHPTDGHPIVENLLNHFRDPFRIDGRELVLSASAGIAIYPTDGDNPTELLRNADSAMYHSKEEGRNTYSYYTDEMNQGVSRRLALEEQMHGALERHEFWLCYQPKFDIANNTLIGVEALLRWNNPALGNVCPDEFIPIAEQTGLIMPIGQLVLSKALEMMANWQQVCNEPFSVAVNLSPRQFRDPNLASIIKEAMDQFNISGQSLELEITEGVLMSGHSFIDKALSDLHDLDICLALDDFGTGYASLSYLRKYPFDVLKIDRSFINDITEDTADRELVNAAISMAHSLGLKVVAEGVETEKQLAMLAEQKCDFVQGYYFSKPVSGEEITKMFNSKNPGKILPLKN